MKLDLTLLALEMEEGTRSQGMPLGAGIGEQTGFCSSRAFRKNQPC